jgi:hypothetical protein
MRQPIRQALMAGVPQVANRVFMRGAADFNTPQPVLLVVMGERVPEDPWAGASEPVEVWIYAKTLTEIDVIQSSVLAVLDSRILQETTATTAQQRYLVVHQDGGVGDYQDPDWGNALVRTVSFRVFTLGWFASTTYEPDPVVTLRQYTEATWPDTQSDPLSWNPSNANPAVYWRVDRVSQVERVNWGSWITASVRGHVLAPDQIVQETWTRRVQEKMTLLKRLRLTDGSDMEVLQNSFFDVNADPMRTGQLRMDIRWGVLDQSFETASTGEPLNRAMLATRAAPTPYIRKVSVRAVLS